ncbi:MAG: Hsp20/alpha crystallin family protein [Acidobacteriota bacterium]|nr:Hsp20/alpha crystallin family protein [Acidobacteriota bacterium]
MTSRSRGAQLEVARIQSEINRLFDMLLRLREGQSSAETWRPGVDVAVTEGHLVVEIELPGVDPASLDVWTEGGNLLLKGKRPVSPLRDRPGAEVLHDEREYGPFDISIPLTAAVNPRDATAKLELGVLLIELPKVKNRRGEAVKISIGETVRTQR